MTRKLFQPLGSDFTGVGASGGSVSRAGARTYIKKNGSLGTLPGDGENISLYSEDTSNWTGSGPWTQTIAAADDTWYKLSVHLDGPELTVEADTATIDGTATVTYGTADLFKCTGAGDVTLTTDTADPKSQLTAIASDMELGPELVTNGGFDADTDWIKGTGWTIAAGVATCDGSQSASTTLYQNLINLNKTKYYKLSATITVSSGTLYAVADGAGAFVATMSGEYEAFILPLVGSWESQFTANSDFIGTVDNVSLKQIPDHALLEPGTYAKTEGSTATIPTLGAFGSGGLHHLGADGYVQLLPYARDLTEWTCSNITPLQDQTGFDGEANGASSLLATDANGTAKYTLTLDATDYVFSARVKRLVGTGTIEMTDDDGTHWTDITSSLSTDSWYRGNITRSQANPVVGFRIVTSGDKIAVDFANVTEGKILYPEVNDSEGGGGSQVYQPGEDITATELSTTLKAIFDAGGVGTVFLEWTPGASKADLSGDYNILALQDAATGLLSYDATNGLLEFYDGTNTASVALDIVSGTAYKIAIRISATGTKAQLSYTTDLATWTDGSEATYAGAITHGDYMFIGNDSGLPGHYRFASIYDEWIADALLTAKFFKESCGGSMSMSMAMK